MAVHPAVPEARELSADEAEKRAELCYELEQRIKASLRTGRESMWDVAQGLHEFDEERGWSALGYDALSDWLADPEIGMTRSTYFRLVQVYREIVVTRKVPAAALPALEMSKVQVVIPAVKSGRVKLADALDDVRGLGKRDLREKYMQRPDPADEAEEAKADEGLSGETEEPVVVNDGTDTPQWASDVEVDDDVIEGTATSIEEPAQKKDDAPSGQVDDELILGREDFLLIFQGLQGWENKSRLTPCPRKEVRATMKKIKAIIEATR